MSTWSRISSEVKGLGSPILRPTAIRALLVRPLYIPGILLHMPVAFLMLIGMIGYLISELCDWVVDRVQHHNPILNAVNEYVAKQYHDAREALHGDRFEPVEVDDDFLDEVNSRDDE